jgi:hypothetical protein
MFNKRTVRDPGVYRREVGWRAAGSAGKATTSLTGGRGSHGASRERRVDDARNMPANCADIPARGGEAPIVVGTESSSGISGDEIHKGSLLWLLTRLSARSRMSSARATGFRGPKPRRRPRSVARSTSGHLVPRGTTRCRPTRTTQAGRHVPHRVPAGDHRDEQAGERANPQRTSGEST